jgi:hypothetical protein
MGWDYHTYLVQPHWFVEAIIQKYEIDMKRAQKSNP